MNSELAINRQWDDNRRPNWFDKINFDTLESLASIGYQPKQIALYFDVPAISFMFYFNQIGSPLQYHYRRGSLIQAAKEGMTMAADAASGRNITQAQRFDKLRDKNAMSSAIDQIFFPDINDI